MALGGSVRFTLDDGESLLIPEEDLRRIYEKLWNLVDVPGAVSTAALVMDARRKRTFNRAPIELTSPQSKVLRRAVDLL